MTFVTVLLLHASLSVPAKELMCQGSDPELRTICQVIESLPSCGRWGKVLKQGAPGDGFHPYWMKDMQSEGIKLASFTVEFDWADGGKKLSHWRIASQKYFRDYDRRAEITQESNIHHIESIGLQKELERVAISRAKLRNWFEYPRQLEGEGYVIILLPDNDRELQSMTPSIYGAYDPGTTALMHASLLGDAERAKELLSSGADVSAVSPEGYTALIYAAASNNPTVVELLLNAGADANAQMKQGGNPLATAVVTNHVESVSLLLKAGADPNSKNSEGESALSIALNRHFEDIAKLLQQAGARP